MQGTVDDVLSGMQRALLGVGAGIGVIAVGGTIAWLASRDDERVSDALDGGPLPGPEPTTANGPGNLAVAWWPQDIRLEQSGRDATLRFQSTVANTGGDPVAIRPGDRLEYTIRRQDTDGSVGEVVGRGSMPLDHVDVEPFPVTAGHGVGRDLSQLGRTLHPIGLLEPAHAAIVGAEHDVQAITINDARAGLYVLRQEIVRPDGTRDPMAFDDTRLTEFLLDGSGGILHTSSRYAND